MSVDTEKPRPVGAGVIELLDPTAKAKPSLKEMAERKGQLAGKTLALIDNTKPNAGSFLDRVGELLSERHPGLVLLKVRKRTSTGPAEFLDNLSGRCDLAIIALGD